jgi:hypothetical protein
VAAVGRMGEVWVGRSYGFASLLALGLDGVSVGGDCLAGTAKHDGLPDGFGGSVRLRDEGSLTIAEWIALRMPRGFRLAACGTECSGVDLSAVELNRVRVGRGSVG